MSLDKALLLPFVVLCACGLFVLLAPRTYCMIDAGYGLL